MQAFISQSYDNHPCTNYCMNRLGRIKNELLKAKWSQFDDCMSSFLGKQMYITLQTQLDRHEVPYQHLCRIDRGVSTWKQALDMKFSKNKLIPPGYHFMYCNPLSSESELSSNDGYDNFQAPADAMQDLFKRRMWVGGSISFSPEPDSNLRFGEPCEFLERVKSFRIMGDDNVLVDVERSFSQDSKIKLQEVRRLMYLNGNYETGKPNKTEKCAPDFQSVVKPTLVTSMRYSGLIFNPHYIHYDRSYTREVEKYPNCLVEGPLSISLLLQYWDVMINGSRSCEKAAVKKLTYKNAYPLFVDSECTLCIKGTEEKMYNLYIKNAEGAVCVDANLEMY